MLVEPTPSIGALPLAGFTIGVTADRRADEQIQLLERKGATVVHGPTIRTHPLGDESGLAAATRSLIDDPPDVTVFITALGVRSWLEAAEALGLADALLDVLERCFADDVNAWELNTDGLWRRLSASKEERRSVQEELRDRHRARAGEHLAAAAASLAILRLLQTRRPIGP